MLGRPKLPVGKVSWPLMCVADMVDPGQQVNSNGDDDGDCSYYLCTKAGTRFRVELRHKVYEIGAGVTTIPNGGSILRGPPRRDLCSMDEVLRQRVAVLRTSLLKARKLCATNDTDSQLSQLKKKCTVAGHSSCQNGAMCRPQAVRLLDQLVRMPRSAVAGRMDVEYSGHGPTNASGADNTAWRSAVGVIAARQRCIFAQSGTQTR